MAFLVSPGVQVNEVDLTNVVPAVSTSIGAIASTFEKGPRFFCSEYYFRRRISKNIW